MGPLTQSNFLGERNAHFGARPQLLVTSATMDSLAEAAQFSFG